MTEKNNSLTCLQGSPCREPQMFIMTKHSLRMALAIVLLSAGAANANDQQELYTKSLAATCANCHGTNGKSIRDGALPSLAGMKSDELIAQMQAFKSGARAATIMHQIAKGFSEQQITALAAYFASQQP
jgi:cytochrome c553